MLFFSKKPRYCVNCGRYSIFQRKGQGIWRCARCGRMAKMRRGFMPVALSILLVATLSFVIIMASRIDNNDQNHDRKVEEQIAQERLLEEEIESKPETEVAEEEPKERTVEPTAEEEVVEESFLMGQTFADVLNVRSGPSTANPRVSVLERGSVVVVLETSGDWLKIYSDVERARDGWVVRDFVNLYNFYPTSENLEDHDVRGDLAVEKAKFKTLLQQYQN